MFFLQEDLLKTAVEAVSAISLNLTIINCHSNFVVLSDVHSDSVEIIPYLKGLLHRVPFSHTICQPQQTLDSMVNSEGLLPFTCKNLSREPKEKFTFETSTDNQHSNTSNGLLTNRTIGNVNDHNTPFYLLCSL
jgi:hypothetical protein